MEPTLTEGDDVLVVTHWGTPNPGDVVVVRGPGGGFVVHRVIAIDGTGILTRGDACLGSDPLVAPRAVLFRAILRRRGKRVEPIPRPGWKAAARRLRFRLTRRLGRLLAAPGRSSKARPSSSTWKDVASWA